MRILDKDADKKTDEVILFLTKAEAQELRDSLSLLLADSPGAQTHHHIPNSDFTKEITVCIYDEINLQGFDKRSVELIKFDR
jgi:hypothetical protein